MASFIKNLKNILGHTIYPVTRTKAVYDDANVILSDTLDLINQKIDAVPAVAGSATKLETPRKINDIPFDGTVDITVADNTKVSNTEMSELLQGARNINLVNGGELKWGVVANTFSWSKVMSIFPGGGKLLRGGVAIKSINIAAGSAVLTSANDCLYITIPTTDGATANVSVGQYNVISGTDKLIIAIRDSDNCLELLGGGWLVYGDTVTAGGTRNVYIPKSIVKAANDFIVGSANATVVKKTLAETKAILGVNNVSNESKTTMFTNPAFTGISTVESNTSYTTRQLRNIIISNADADLAQMQDGDIWIKV